MDAKRTAVYAGGTADPTYLDLQAYVGITKHVGVYAATDRLHQLCHVGGARDVLEAGCGVGVGPVYVAKKYGCRVVAIDVSERMLIWARERAQRAGVADPIEFRLADVRHLPYEDDRFDAVLAESVLAFVADKGAAVEELEVAAKQEMKDRIAWIGWRSVLGAWRRMARLLLANPGARRALKQQLTVPKKYYTALGCALFVGRKPAR